MRRKRLAIGLVVLNLLLGAAITFTPLRAQLLPNAARFDCCKGEICCDNCCWFVHDCDSSDDCEDLN